MYKRQLEEQLAVDVIDGRGDHSVPDLVVLCADATNLVRNLYVLLQVQEFGRNVIVALTMLDEAAVGYRLVLTKADKVKASDLALTREAVAAEARKHPAAFPELLVTSSEKGMGIDELRAAVLADIRL